MNQQGPQPGYKPEGALKSTEDIAMERADEIVERGRQEEERKKEEWRQNLDTEKERTLSDQSLMEEGAEYRVDQNDNAYLELTKEQVEKAREEMNEVFEKKKQKEKQEEEERKSKITGAAQKKTEKEAKILAGGGHYEINAQGQKVAVEARQQNTQSKSTIRKIFKKTGEWFSPIKKFFNDYFTNPFK